MLSEWRIRPSKTLKKTKSSSGHLLEIKHICMNAIHSINRRDLLSDLLGTIQDFTGSGDRYFSQAGKRQIINPVQTDIQLDVHELRGSILVEVFDELGIRSVTLDRPLNRSEFSNDMQLPARRSMNEYRWHIFRGTSFQENLKKVMSDCLVIVFSEWARVEGASQLWDGLLCDVIKPLNRTDIHFIFSLGDLERKLTHEVDEIIDIISDFSIHGKVTLLLNEKEAEQLWMVLNGAPSDPSTAQGDWKDGYRSIFNAMRVDRFLIYSVDRALLYSNQQLFELTGMTLSNRKISGEVSDNVKDHFNVGYSLGLLLQFDFPHCIALGLTVSGAYVESGISPDRRAMISYIKRWIESLDAGNDKVESGVTQFRVID